MQDTIIIQSSLEIHFHNAIQHGQVVIFHAPCGYGKTVVARELLKKKRVYYTSAREDQLLLPGEKEQWEILLVDDLHHLQEEALQTQLCELIKQNTTRRFVLLTRGMVPNWLIDFRMAGLLFTVDKSMLTFCREDIARYFAYCGLELNHPEISAIAEKTLGYPAAIHFMKERLLRGKVLRQALFDAVTADLYHYLEGAVFLRLDKEIRALLIRLSPFRTFDVKAACAINGSENTELVLRRLLRYSSMLEETENDDLCFNEVFFGFLQWERPQYYSEQDYRRICSVAGNYFEKADDLNRALEAYSMSEDMKKVAELLANGVDQYLGLAEYRQVERYYRKTPEALLKKSPALMQGMSIVNGLAHRFDESERWYDLLKKAYEEQPVGSEEKIRIHSRLLWLDVVLPQRAVSLLPEQIQQMYELHTKGELLLHRFPITGQLPSILNGGKDFSELSGRDEELFRLLEEPLRIVMGADGVGLAQCAYAESRFIRGENIGRDILELVSRLNSVQQFGTADIEFAIVGLLVRNQLDMGDEDNALRTAMNLRRRFAEIGEEQFFPNLDAMICRIQLYRDEIPSADSWYREQAPLDCISVDILKRYQYLTQAMVEIAEGKYSAALLTLASLELLLAESERIADSMHLHFLKAIAFYRLDDSTWKESFASAFSLAEQYGFVRSVTQYAGAILPLLERHGRGRNASGSFYKKVLPKTRIQAAHYPNFLQVHSSLNEELTSAEYNVLKLLCAGKSNNDICQTLGIKLPTVKCHVSRILTKLGVRRRNEVKEAAQRLYLLND